MTQEHLDHAFDKFYRADTSTTAVSGLGLGIITAKQIVKIHSGTIRIESIAGEGSTLVFTLPFAVN